MERTNARECVFRTAHMEYAIGSDGTNLRLLDRTAKTDHLANAGAPCALLTCMDGSVERSVSAWLDGETLLLRFVGGGEASIRIEADEEALRFTVERVACKEARSLRFVNIEVDVDYEAGEIPFAACLLALTLRTRMGEFPGMNMRLIAEAYAKTGFFGSSAAVIGMPEPLLRGAMKGALARVPSGELPKGAWCGVNALDCPFGNATYTVLHEPIDLSRVDEIRQSMRAFGVTQLELEQGAFYRQGDFRPDPALFPNGVDDLRALIDGFHREGMQVMLHSYSYFLDSVTTRDPSPYLSPVPRNDIAVCETYALACDLDEDALLAEMRDLPDDFDDKHLNFSPYSALVRIDDELLLIHAAPLQDGKRMLSFSERGALGTRKAQHSRGVAVRRLSQRFGYLAPAKESPLFFEIAQNTARFLEDCGFDGVYFDAFEGANLFDGEEMAWYHSGLFLREVLNHVSRPLLVNGVYHVHLTASWFARTRLGAFDPAFRGYRQNDDTHVAFNARHARRCYLYGEMGWQSLYPRYWEPDPEARYPVGHQSKPRFPEDVTYTLVKQLATNASNCWRSEYFAWRDNPMLERFQSIVARFAQAKKRLRLDASQKRALAAPNAEFDLIQNEAGAWRFVECRTISFRPLLDETHRAVHTVVNPFPPQQARVRIESGFVCAPMDSADGVPILCGEERAVRGGETFAFPSVNARWLHGLGVRLYGDGHGETVCLRLKSAPRSPDWGQADYFIHVDFTGWRTFYFGECRNCEETPPHWFDFEPNEPRGESGMDYPAHLAMVDFSDLGSLTLLAYPAGDYHLRLGEVRALPTRNAPAENVTLRVGKAGFRLAGSIPSGCFTELATGDTTCAVRDMQGQIVSICAVEGDLPLLQPDENRIECTAKDACSLRVTLFLTNG